MSATTIQQSGSAELIATTVCRDPLWYKDAVIYQLNVKAFSDSNDDGIGDFKGVTAKLDYVRDLGVNTVWLMPFYPSPLRDDGYDISNYDDIHPQFGTLEDFREMLAAAHQRGLRVMTELVINHTSDAHPWFQAARKAPPGSPERDFYVWSDTDQKYRGTRIIFTDTEVSNWTFDPVAKAFFWHRFFSHQPDLNFDNPAVMEAITRVMRFWLDLGVDGFRLDAIPYLVERDGTNNENLPETHAVIKQLRASIDANYQNRFLLAEANQWPEDVRDYFGDGDECHMAYHFPLMPRIYMAIAQEDRFPVVEIMQQTPEIPEACQWAIFLRNHDELTLEMVTSKERDYMYNTYAADPRARINLGIRRRLAPLMENDIERIKLMNSLLLSMHGSPIIYYGDEIGMGDNVFVGDRNGVRTPMQWSPDRNAGFSRGDPQRLYLAPIMDAVYGYQAVNVESQMLDKSSLLNWMRRMLTVRQSTRTFGRGDQVFLKPGNRKILAYLRTHGSETMLCVANLARSAQPVELELSRYKGRVPVELLGRTTFPPIGELPYQLSISAYGFYWFRLAADADVPNWHQPASIADERPVLVLFDGFLSLFRDQVVPWRISMAVKTRSQFENDTLPRFIETQRWYSSKGMTIDRARIADSAIWTEGGRSWLLPLVELDGPAEAPAYFVPLAMAWEDSDDERMRALAPAALARIRQQANVGVMGDAFADEAFCRALVGAIGANRELATEKGKLNFRPSLTYAQIAGAHLGEQPFIRRQAVTSNTLITFGERLFVKGYRRIREGINPEFEIGHHLTDVAHFPNCVPVAGALDYTRADGKVMTLALIQGFVPNQGDGWEFTSEYLRRHLGERRGSAAPIPSDVHGGYLELAAVLGQRTAELHLAFALRTGNPAFEPEPLSAADLAILSKQVNAQAAVALDELQARRAGLPADALAEAEAVLRARPKVRQCIEEFAANLPPALKTRTHGDYHLGQVLLTRNDFVIVDFEGEPGRTFEERRRKSSPLRDVAGMLRSFSYARLNALRLAAQTDVELAELAPLAADWERQARSTFLQAYDARAQGSGLYGSLDPGKGMLGLFELEKALYELHYELANRPDWVRIPLQGILAILRTD